MTTRRTYEYLFRLLFDAGCDWREADRIARDMSRRYVVLDAAA